MNQIRYDYPMGEGNSAIPVKMGIVGRYGGENIPEEAQSVTGDQLATIGNRIADIRGVSQSLFKRLSPILVPSPEVDTVKEPRSAAPTKLGQGLDEIIDQLDVVLSYLRDLHETIRL